MISLKVVLQLLIVIAVTSSKNLTLKRFLIRKPNIHEKIKENNVNILVAKYAYKKCLKTGIKNFVDETPFIIEQGDICRGRVSILIAVHSKNQNSARRQMIRETYGSIRRIGYLTIRLAFFVGSSANNLEQRNLINENEINRDIVQRDFIDSYRNMTRKHLSVMEWIMRHCLHAEYLLKTDDDIFIDIYHLVREIEEGHAKKGFLCSATNNTRPDRSQKGGRKKWFVTREEYKPNRYPTYCEGFGYILPIIFVPQLFACSLFTDYFWIDDVQVAGVLPQLLGIPRMAFSPGGGYLFMVPTHASNQVLDAVFFIAYYNEFVNHHWLRLWRSVIKYSMNI